MIEVPPRLDLRPDHWVIVQTILRQHVPGCKVLVFGSRAKWTAKEYSDLDLAIVGADPLPIKAMSALLEEFGESDLPFKVDIVDWAKIDEDFRNIIRRDGVTAQAKEPAAKPRKRMLRQSTYGLFFPADFAKSHLANLCSGSDGIQTGPIGSQLHKRDYVETGTPIIAVEHLGDNRVIRDGDVPQVSEQDTGRSSKFVLRSGDIVFSLVGSVDRRALVQKKEEGWLFPGRCLRIRPDPKRILPTYLSYFFGLPSFQEHIRAIAGWYRNGLA